MKQKQRIITQRIVSIFMAIIILLGIVAPAHNIYANEKKKEEIEWDYISVTKEINNWVIEYDKASPDNQKEMLNNVSINLEEDSFLNKSGADVKLSDEGMRLIELEYKQLLNLISENNKERPSDEQLNTLIQFINKIETKLEETFRKYVVEVFAFPVSIMIDDEEYSMWPNDESIFNNNFFSIHDGDELSDIQSNPSNNNPFNYIMPRAYIVPDSIKEQTEIMLDMYYELSTDDVLDEWWFDVYQTFRYSYGFDNQLVNKSEFINKMSLANNINYDFYITREPLIATFSGEDKKPIINDILPEGIKDANYKYIGSNQYMDNVDIKLKNQEHKYNAKINLKDVLSLTNTVHLSKYQDSTKSLLRNKEYTEDNSIQVNNNDNELSTDNKISLYKLNTLGGFSKPYSKEVVGDIKAINDLIMPITLANNAYNYASSNFNYPLQGVAFSTNVDIYRFFHINSFNNFGLDDKYDKVNSLNLNKLLKNELGNEINKENILSKVMIDTDSVSINGNKSVEIEISPHEIYFLVIDDDYDNANIITVGEQLDDTKYDGMYFVSTTDLNYRNYEDILKLLGPDAHKAYSYPTFYSSLLPINKDTRKISDIKRGFGEINYDIVTYNDVLSIEENISKLPTNKNSKKTEDAYKHIYVKNKKQDGEMFQYTMTSTISPKQIFLTNNNTKEFVYNYNDVNLKTFTDEDINDNLDIEISIKNQNSLPVYETRGKIINGNYIGIKDEKQGMSWNDIKTSIQNLNDYHSDTTLSKYIQSNMLTQAATTNPQHQVDDIVTNIKEISEIDDYDDFVAYIKEVPENNKVLVLSIIDSMMIIWPDIFNLDISTSDIFFYLASDAIKQIVSPSESFNKTKNETVLSYVNNKPEYIREDIQKASKTLQNILTEKQLDIAPKTYEEILNMTLQEAIEYMINAIIAAIKNTDKLEQTMGLWFLVKDISRDVSNMIEFGVLSKNDMHKLINGIAYEMANNFIIKDTTNMTDDEIINTVIYNNLLYDIINESKTDIISAIESHGDINEDKIVSSEQYVIYTLFVMSLYDAFDIMGPSLDIDYIIKNSAESMAQIKDTVPFVIDDKKINNIMKHLSDKERETILEYYQNNDITDVDENISTDTTRKIIDITTNKDTIKDKDNEDLRVNVIETSINLNNLYANLLDTKQDDLLNNVDNQLTIDVIVTTNFKDKDNLIPRINRQHNSTISLTSNEASLIYVVQFPGIPMRMVGQSGSHEQTIYDISQVSTQTADSNITLVSEKNLLDLINIGKSDMKEELLNNTVFEIMNKESTTQLLYDNDSEVYKLSENIVENEVEYILSQKYVGKGYRLNNQKYHIKEKDGWYYIKNDEGQWVDIKESPYESLQYQYDSDNDKHILVFYNYKAQGLPSTGTPLIAMLFVSIIIVAIYIDKRKDKYRF